MSEEFTINHRVPNFSLRQGDAPGCVEWHFCVKKNLINKIRYWLFCKFFPFKIIKWEDLKDV